MKESGLVQDVIYYTQRMIKKRGKLNTHYGL